MNICFLSKTFNQTKGGIENYTLQMAKILAKKGHNIHIITSNNGNLDFNIGNSIYIHKIKTNDLFKGSWIINRVIPFDNLLYSKRVSNKLNELIKKYKIDILESPDWLYEGLWFSFKKKIPIIVKLHGHNSIFKCYLYKELTYRQRIEMLFERKMIMNADIITSVSNYYSNLISNIWNLKKDIRIIYNAIDEIIFRKPLENTSEDTNILFVGRLGTSKGIDVLLKTAPLLWKSYPELKFILIGEKDSTLKSCPKYCLNSTNDKRIQILNSLPQEKLITFYMNSTICVFPSRFENLSTVTIEAMACGKPVIATNVGGFPEIIDDKINGMLIPNENVQALADAIKSILQSKDLQVYLGMNARKKMEDKFNLNRIADETVNIYSEAIKKFLKIYG